MHSFKSLFWARGRETILIVCFPLIALAVFPVLVLLFHCALAGFSVLTIQYREFSPSGVVAVTGTEYTTENTDTEN